MSGPVHKGDGRGGDPAGGSRNECEQARASGRGHASAAAGEERRSKHGEAAAGEREMRRVEWAISPTGTSQ